MRISDWSSDVCSSDLHSEQIVLVRVLDQHIHDVADLQANADIAQVYASIDFRRIRLRATGSADVSIFVRLPDFIDDNGEGRSEERRVGKACVRWCRTRW